MKHFGVMATEKKLNALEKNSVEGKQNIMTIIRTVVVSVVFYFDEEKKP